jgi:DNA-binding beta-propeller fold protein YncE
MSALRAVALLLPLLLGACREPEPPLVVGRPGLNDGEFDRPRGIAAAGGQFAVVDVTGRLQRFTTDGKFVSSHTVMPAGSRRGFPLGLILLPGGDSLVVHTHESGMVRYSPDGKELSRWGTGGVREGEFCMPQRAVIRGDEVLVTDFGYEPCRAVKAFTREGKFLRRLGGPGTEAVFQRPMGLALDPAGVLWVADSSHRLFRFEEATGRCLGSVGSEGSGPDQVTWPTGLAALPDGTVIACEAGNGRLHRFGADGRSLGVYGRTGSGPGEFRSPWDLAADPPFLFVADTENHRVQRLRIDDIPWESAPGGAR